MNHELTMEAHAHLIASLQCFGNTLSAQHEEALYALVEAMTDMAHGSLKGRYAFPLPTGAGKTRAIIEWATAVSRLGLPLSLIVSASRIEALCALKRDMMGNGVPEKQIGLIYTRVFEKGNKGKATELKYSLPPTEDDNDQRPFLLCSHQLIRSREANLDLYNVYQGKPRDLCIYDESLMVSDLDNFPVEDLCKSIFAWIGKFTFDEKSNRVAILNWLNEQKTRIEGTYAGFQADKVNELPEVTFRLPLDTEAEYQRYFRKHDTLLADFMNISTMPLRMLRNGKTVMVSYRVVIPDALANMIVLDASYPVRKLEQADAGLRNAEQDLPSCEGVKFDEVKRFDRVILYRMAQRGSRTSAATDKARQKKLMQDIVKIMHDIPRGEKVLCFVYKERNNSNPKAVLEAALKNASLIPKDGEPSNRIFIETWGNETSLNSYAHCQHVILVGILHRDLLDLEGSWYAQTRNIRGHIPPADLKAIALSERVHCAYQALSRGTCRVMGAPGQASPMTGYVVEFEEGFEEELSKVMPGVRWQEWEPVYVDKEAHGLLVLGLVDKIRRVLGCLTVGETISRRRLKAQCAAGRADHNTWLRAVIKAIEGKREYKPIAQSILKAA